MPAMSQITPLGIGDTEMNKYIAGQVVRNTKEDNTAEQRVASGKRP